ncbi:MAG: ECF transporter S component [Lachnospiraceae bacterium]|nr:ECF transporter S component [Lachnospiraceae bacterium]
MKERTNLKVLVATAMLAAVAGVLMSLEISIPFMPPFYKLDFSDVPSIIALFAYGPASGAAVEVLKILIKLVTVGTNTAYVGELANLIGVVLFIVPLWLVFKKMNCTKKAAKVSLMVSVPVRIAFSCCVNAFITLPLYAAAMNLSMDAVVQMVGSVNPAITNLPTFIVLATIPFNLLKNVLNCVIGYALYERLSNVHVFERRFAES